MRLSESLFELSKIRFVGADPDDSELGNLLIQLEEVLKRQLKQCYFNVVVIFCLLFFEVYDLESSEWKD